MEAIFKDRILKKIILGSNSPRRRELLAGLNIPFEVHVIPNVDESYPDTLDPYETAEYIAAKKAEAYRSLLDEEEVEEDAEKNAEVSDKESEDTSDLPVYAGDKNIEPVVLTADTVVIAPTDDEQNDQEGKGIILGKPKTAAEAHDMLRMLSGKTHHVVTGVCLVSKKETRKFSVVTEVSFKELSDAEINFYIHCYKPFDKAGAYGIQEWIGYIGCTGLKGSYFNVMGLPVQRIYEELQKM